MSANRVVVKVDGRVYEVINNALVQVLSLDIDADNSDHVDNDAYDSDCVIVPDDEDVECNISENTEENTDCTVGDLEDPVTICENLQDQSDPCPLVLEVQSFDVPNYSDKPVCSAFDLAVSTEKTAVRSTELNDPSENPPVILNIDNTDHSAVSVASSVARDDVVDTVTSDTDDSSVLSLGISARPMVVAPAVLHTDISPFSVISSPRTLTEQEAIAAGWFTDKGNNLQSKCLPAMDYVPTNNFMSSVETVTLVTLDVPDDAQSTNFVHGASLVEANDELSCDSDSDKPNIGMDTTPVVVEGLIDNKPWDKLEKFLHGEKSNVADAGLASSKIKDEPTPTAEMKPYVNIACTRPTETYPSVRSKRHCSENVNYTCKRKYVSKHPRSQVFKQSPHESFPKIYKARRSGGRPRTARERHNLKDCYVSLQQLWLRGHHVKVRALWRYICCRDLVPDSAEGCTLCHSMQQFELKVAHKFRAGTKKCKKLSRKYCEFSIDPYLKTASPSKLGSKSTVNSEKAQQVTTVPAASSAEKEDNKYLLIRSESGMFVVPVESAVACIISEQEISQLL